VGEKMDLLKLCNSCREVIMQQLEDKEWSMTNAEAGLKWVEVCRSQQMLL